MNPLGNLFRDCDSYSNSCSDPCNKCGPANYDSFSNNSLVCPDPFGDSGKETDTSVSIDYSGRVLNYKAERHTDQITGTQLGSIINLGDLRDVNTYSDTDAMCSEFIFHRYGECGDGCRSLKDSWSRFSIDDEGAKSDSIRYVRGANAYGCPKFLDIPSNPDQFWYAGWRLEGEHKEFGYYQAVPGDLPKDDNGNYVIASQDPVTKQPIIGSLPLDCILSNIMGSVGMNVYSEYSKIQEYKYTSGVMNPVTGEFSVYWEDWEDAQTHHVGNGTITGRMTIDSSFDTGTGNMVYTISSITYDKVAYQVVTPTSPGVQPLYLTLKGISIPGKQETTLVNHYQYDGRSNWSINLNQTIQCNANFSVAPGQTVGPFQYLYIYVDWVYDDEGYMNLYFQNKLQGWKTC